MNNEIRNEMAVNRPDHEKEIMAIIASAISPKAMREKLEDYHELDVAEVMPKLPPQELKKLLRILTVDMLADIFEYVDEEEAGQYIMTMDVHKAAQILSDVDSDTAVAILRTLDDGLKVKLVELMEKESKDDVQLVASFSEDEIGSRMTTNYVSVKWDLSIKEAMSELIRQAGKKDNISTIFSVDQNEVFYGAIDLQELIIAREDQKLDDLIVTSFPYVYGSQDIDDCIEDLKDWSEDSIPVLDNANKLLGVITSQTIVEMTDESMGEDYAMLAGLTTSEDLNEPLKDSIRKRLPWLLALLGLGLVVSSVVGAFESVVSQLTIIMAFQSMILDMSGNVGTQSLAVTIRVLVDDELTWREKVHLVVKEMRVGLCNGVVLGLLSFAFVGLYIALIKHKTFFFAYAVSGCIGASLVLSMLISSATGTLIPMFFVKIKVDPAVASGPLITTVNDLVAVIAYYGLSSIFLIDMFHLAG